MCHKIPSTICKNKIPYSSSIIYEKFYLKTHGKKEIIIEYPPGYVSNNATNQNQKYVEN
jgi:hypothetical protein